jgi:predicted enzyme related to lactoylglutathione lyase
VHFEIHASNPGRIRAFYESVFGWTMSQWGDQPYWLISTGDGNPMAGVASSEPGIDGAMLPRVGPPPSDGQPVNGWVVTVSVPDCQGYLDKAIAAGATEAMPMAVVPGVGWLAYIKDPDGNTLGMLQPDASAGSNP